MAITDLQISDTLTTDAPSIKYEGNQGPQSPQQERQVAQLKEEYLQYVFEQKDLGAPILSFEEWYQMTYEASKMGVQAPQQVSGVMKAAYGGIMRQKYGLGKFVRKLIPNEIARAAEVAAPFVAMAAPQFALPAALAGGLGTYDRTGKLGGALKSGAMTYGLGTLSPGMERFKDVGGTNIWNTRSGLHDMYNLGSGTKTQGIRDLNPFKKDPPKKITSGNTIGKNSSDIYESIDDSYTTGKEFNIEKIAEDTKNVSGILKTIDKFAIPILLGSMGIAAATAKPQDMKEAVNATRGTKLDIDAIRKEVQEALAGGEEAWAILQAKYPYVGEFPTKKAEGGRIGLYAGGVPSPYSMEDARKTSMQDKMGGITDVMKRADLFRAGDVGQMYMAQGGRIGYEGGGITKLASHEANDAFLEQRYEFYLEQGFSPRDAAEKAQKDLMEGNYQDLAQGGRIGYDDGGPTAEEFQKDKMYNEMMKYLHEYEQYKKHYKDEKRRRSGIQEAAQGGRIGAEEGGLMNLGGMEKDYRNDGGFVPIGGKEKADDVPARLSKNEFVFTADAVRGAGGGDIDKGAAIMENVMKNLEQGGQISEETQGLAGAQEMFDVSERIGEVI